MLSTKEQIDLFFQSKAFGVIGASSNREKYGNKVLRCYLQHHKTVYPVNPKEETIEGLSVVHSINQLPKEVNSLSIITPPTITKVIVEEAIKKGIRNIWMQPGAEDEEAIEKCFKHHVNLIAQGPCVLVAMGFKDL